MNHLHPFGWRFFWKGRTSSEILKENVPLPIIMGEKWVDYTLYADACVFHHLALNKNWVDDSTQKSQGVNRLTEVEPCCWFTSIDTQATPLPPKKRNVWKGWIKTHPHNDNYNQPRDKHHASAGHLHPRTIPRYAQHDRHADRSDK